MGNKTLTLTVIPAVFLSLCCEFALAKPASREKELEKSVEALRQEVRELRKAVDEKAAGGKPAKGDKKAHGDKKNSKRKQTLKIGLYGELHYNNLSADDASNDVEEIDLHRFALKAKYRFTDKIRLVSEVEFEHGVTGEGQEGEVEVTQMYVEFDLNADWKARGGVILLPIGILNHAHKPPSFYGVERNSVESIIIPTNWWAGGGGVTADLGKGLTWDFMIHEGLSMPTDGSSAFRVRSGRQRTSEAEASDVAVTSRIAYNGVSGLKLGLAANYQADASQQSNDGLDEGLLIVANAQYDAGRFSVRGLFGQWNFSGDAIEAADADEQTGWYLEPSYKLCRQWGIYARYEDLDAARVQDQFEQWEIGFNYWPTPKVVLKADFRSREHDLDVASGRDFDGFDLGIGFYF